MNSDAPKHNAGLNLSKQSQPASVPVFNCIVYVSRAAEAGVRARVANLAGLESTAATERAALAKIVPAFKQCVTDLLQSGAQIPWIEPVAAPEPGEQTRRIAVHL